MRITIFGATGKVGQLVVAEALARDHTVVAFQRQVNLLIDKSRLEIVQGDIHDATKVAAAVQGSDAIISTLGSWGTPNKDILTTGIRNIIPAMEKYDVKRIISLTGTDARAPGDELSTVHLLTHWLLGLFAAKVLADGEAHIQLLAESGLDWTVVRSPVMNNSGKKQHAFTEKRPMPWATINRQAVASSLVDQLESTNQLRQAPYIARG